MKNKLDKFNRCLEMAEERYHKPEGIHKNYSLEQKEKDIIKFQ